MFLPAFPLVGPFDICSLVIFLRRTSLNSVIRVEDVPTLDVCAEGEAARLRTRVHPPSTFFLTPFLVCTLELFSIRHPWARILFTVFKRRSMSWAHCCFSLVEWDTSPTVVTHHVCIFVERLTEAHNEFKNISQLLTSTDMCVIVSSGSYLLLTCVSSRVSGWCAQEFL